MPIIATCQTDGCHAAGKAIDVTDALTPYTDAESGETITVTSVYCGTCGNRIEDVTHD